MAPARRASANVDAPVWKSYVAARTDDATSVVKAPLALVRSRKRVKPTATTEAAGNFNSKQHVATRASVRAYWEALTIAERLQILMVDDPDIVKQLYKLNLSLLCVGLMQRHLKAGTTRATTAVTPNSNNSSTEGHVAASTAPASASSDTMAPSDSERTYDLLEAMEFMDIGTGILTVKTELVEDVDHMFALVTAVLHGFVATIHVLSDAQFRALFVAESEVINTWEDYERLIAMLVEQLMLRSYVAHLEKQATEQMVALLLEASREANASSSADVPFSGQSQKKKKKKQKKKLRAAKMVEPMAPTVSMVDDAPSDSESEPDMEESADVVAEEMTWQSECSTEDADLSGPSSPVKSVAKAINRLNPHAPAFEPASSIGELFSPVSGKRKLDDFIIHIPWQDIVDGFDNDNEEPKMTIEAGELGCRRRPREKHRRRDEDAELEWHLQHMYASTASLFGWDFNEQREIVAVPSQPWTDASLWRTDPREVVRYYLPPRDNPPVFPSVPFPQDASLAPSPTGPPSRYYYTPDHARHPTSGGGSASPPSAPAIFPPFMPPPSGPPVSFWDEATPSQYPPVFEAQPFPRFRSTNSPVRRRKAPEPR